VKSRAVLVCVLVALSCGAPAPRPAPVVPAFEPSPQALRDAAARFGTFREGFLEWYYEAYPVRASQLGIAVHDSRLPAMDRGSIQARIDALLDWDTQLRRISIQLMRDGDRGDYPLLEFAIRSELLELEEIRRWAADPGLYTRWIADGVVAVAERRSVPATERAESLRGRLEGAGALLSAARANVRNPPRDWTEASIQEATALAAYLEENLPALLGPAAAAIEPARAALVGALRDQVGWLETELLPVSTGEFRLGRYLFSRALLYEGHVDASVQDLQRLTEERLAHYREVLEQVAAELDPGRTPAAILDSLRQPQLPADEVVASARSTMLEARDWVAGAGVVTIPAAPTPEVRAATSPREGLDVMDLRSPGPFADPAADAALEVRTGRRGMASLAGAAARWTYPGEYVRRLHEPTLPTDVRRVFAPRTYTEGWAHYAEGMAFDEGFRGGDPAARLGHVHRSLQDQALWYAAVQLHALGQPLDRVVERVMEMAHLDEDAARRLALRVTRDPLVFVGALGRVQITELRNTYVEHLEEQDEEFSLQAFHDRLLGLGLPIALATEVFMPPPPPPRVRTGAPQRPPFMVQH
jgi:hypothetical protein